MPPREQSRSITESRVIQLFRKLLRTEVRRGFSGMRYAVAVSFGDGTNPVGVGAQFWWRVDRAFNIVHWYMTGDVSGSIQIDIWKDAYANYPPTDADSITGVNPPLLSSAISNDSVPTGWSTTQVNVGDVLKFNVDSATTITRCVLTLTVDST